MSTVNSNVEYREIKGFPGYRVGSDGTVWSRLTNKGKLGNWIKLKGSISSGYIVYGLYNQSILSLRLGHRIVLEAFIGLRPKGYQCCHYDGNKLNNKLDNLRWDTVSNNSLDKERHKRGFTGTRNPKVKISEREVLDIRKEYSDGDISQSKLGKKYNITQATVSKIVLRQIWDHI